MAPMYGQPNFSFLESEESSEGGFSFELDDKAELTAMAFWYMIVLIAMLLTWLIVFFCLRIIAMRQKTRNPQRRRMYVGSRTQPALSQPEPTIYVSPANLPPPPKYEALAPPSYEEVVGIHYPNYQSTQIQPITTPITTALAQSSNATPSNVTNTSEPSTVITVTSEDRRTSVTVATS